MVLLFDLLLKSVVELSVESLEKLLLDLLAESPLESSVELFLALLFVLLLKLVVEFSVKSLEKLLLDLLEAPRGWGASPLMPMEARTGISIKKKEYFPSLSDSRPGRLSRPSVSEIQRKWRGGSSESTKNFRL